MQPQNTPPPMPTPPPVPGEVNTQLPQHQPHPRSSMSLWVTVAVVGLAIVAAVLAYFIFFMPKATPTPTTTATNQQTSKKDAETIAAEARMLANTNRKEDAGSLLSTIAAYMANNMGTTPQKVAGSGLEIELCGTTCDSKETVTLTHYMASNISIKDFSATLVAPDADTAYIVRGAECKSDGRGIGPVAASSSRSMVIVFALDAGADPIEQHCQST